MKLFISGELDSGISDSFRSVRRSIESIFNEQLGSVSYGDDVVEIALIPIILGPRFQGNGRKERRLIQRREKAADYRLFIDFSSFVAGSETERKRLLVQNLTEAVTDIDRKLKGRFDGNRLVHDINRIFKDVLTN